MSVEDAWNLLSYNLVLKDTADRFQAGTINTFGVFALNESLKLFKEFGFDEAEKNVLANSRYLIEQLQEIGIEPILKDCENSNIAGIVSFKHPQAETLFKQLTERNVNSAVREGMLRLSPHFYNTMEDIDKVIEIMKELQG
jgi:selenocysteine lyase/cysteine desulfurase